MIPDAPAPHPESFNGKVQRCILWRISRTRGLALQGSSGKLPTSYRGSTIVSFRGDAALTRGISAKTLSEQNS